MGRPRVWDKESTDPATVKRCPRCGIEKPVLAEFYWTKKSPKPLPYCKPCQNAALTEWRRAHPERVAQVSRDFNDRKLYGVESGTRDRMLREQDGRCAICGASQAVLRRSLHIDHDAATGVIRDLLCHGCNTGLGAFAHRPDLLRAAADYMVRHTSRRNVR